MTAKTTKRRTAAKKAPAVTEAMVDEKVSAAIQAIPMPDYAGFIQSKMQEHSADYDRRLQALVNAQGARAGAAMTPPPGLANFKVRAPWMVVSQSAHGPSNTITLAMQCGRNAVVRTVTFVANQDGTTSVSESSCVVAGTVPCRIGDTDNCEFHQA